MHISTQVTAIQIRYTTAPMSVKCLAEVTYKTQKLRSSFLIGKACLITRSFRSEAFDRLIFKGQRSVWFLAVRRSHWSLDQPPKRALVTWFKFDPGHKRFYMGHISDYPLWVRACTCATNTSSRQGNYALSGSGSVHINMIFVIIILFMIIYTSLVSHCCKDIQR